MDSEQIRLTTNTAYDHSPDWGKLLTGTHVGVFRPSAREFIFNIAPVTRTSFGLVPISQLLVIGMETIRPISVCSGHLLSSSSSILHQFLVQPLDLAPISRSPEIGMEILLPISEFSAHQHVSSYSILTPFTRLILVKALIFRLPGTGIVMAEPI